MIEKTLEMLSKTFALEERDAGAYRVQKVKGMTFCTRAFQVQGIGNLSILDASGMFGLMKMQTIILTPLYRDAPLFSYDRIHAMGNDTFILEFYDTMLDKSAGTYAEYIKDLEREKEKIRDIPDHDLGKHWYDPIKLPVSVSKRTKKQDELLNGQYLNTLEVYKGMVENAPVVDAAAKREKTSVYVNGLFENGGPSTDAFVKSIGMEKARDMFENFIFGVK